MNDLVAVGKDKFYITKFFHYRDMLWRTLEFLSQKAWGGIMYYDGRKARDAVSSGLHMPNGINVSPDGKMIYVSEFGNNKLLGYHKYESNGLNKAWERYVDTHVDNIEVDPTNGDLWIGCHPVGYRIYDLFNWFKHLAPSQVLRFRMEDNTVSSIEQIYADDGSELQGSTTAAFVGGKLIIGTVVKQTLVCDVNYLSS
ncbi:serum paraoxonase/arylesterase 1-like [Mercenaria mercenaria]|uniref:serum paraoxonase/arylesterase 1-like n=1 Tax=Mercenaria mercenaria TaxID=6596 RepID=UPI00234E620B|nr:serum paraoxonase/arylesterase 1-like [Mercenaria mercenaria]